mmetsp:Transcript_60290/g.191530  ORF Transcript_60290/g.191530 Transcript_60290/m.191530 type:complete len:277 (+) Transcript_60290:139-969(+)|eukprot:CAMPEP_0182865560 /NCGR_PEP_ID=MMETSP0034_2-20130328/7754_1 /TAXON_ID=156128 /ORGANISM="Nephroselmis pyriformis, Strain CCMP717" /LENGTH=276 /DNA_ID=CAMNT_0024997863 /DNA_START=139 /DNA_END=969 /DNA_ORIENTATION=+
MLGPVSRRVLARSEVEHARGGAVGLRRWLASSTQPQLEGAGSSELEGNSLGGDQREAALLPGQQREVKAAMRPKPNLQTLSMPVAPLSVTRHYATNSALLIDTHAMVCRFEETGLSRAQAETLTSSIAEAVTAALHRIHDEHTSKFELEKAMMKTDGDINGFKSEVTRSMEMHMNQVNTDTERLQVECEKLRQEIRYEVEKLTASARLDMNLEKGRIRDELGIHDNKRLAIETRLDREVNAMKTAIEQSKNELIKYTIGILATITTVGLAAVRLII